MTQQRSDNPKHICCRTVETLRFLNRDKHWAVAVHVQALYVADHGSVDDRIVVAAEICHLDRHLRFGDQHASNNIHDIWCNQSKRLSHLPRTCGQQLLFICQQLKVLSFNYFSLFSLRMCSVLCAPPNSVGPPRKTLHWFPLTVKNVSNAYNTQIHIFHADFTWRWHKYEIR